VPLTLRKDDYREGELVRRRQANDARKYGQQGMEEKRQLKIKSENQSSATNRLGRNIIDDKSVENRAATSNRRLQMKTSRCVDQYSGSSVRWEENRSRNLESTKEQNSKDSLRKEMPSMVTHREGNNKLLKRRISKAVRCSRSRENRTSNPQNNKQWFRTWSQ
jgi:hypothetical protein